MNQYLTDTDAWFVKTNLNNGLISMQRRPMELTIDNEFDTENAKYKFTERYIPGWSDPRGLYGSPGA